ncbi:hypothetical protein JOF48_000325 [Arthrobacter stackebrandtii]|uniref:Polysaccharide pyruvyl transferase domain-containing protein n=1 Tax=Arthrobacter stackebrandtii TaxID=272161 RepID=A0ABS4YRV1_9MICC|nr:hypothetical protein [Arthrobacter stackebrandtii]PYH00204.1 hypothetical protein CVV67_10585 [Arthrobacter stackebrandtii]
MVHASTQSADLRSAGGHNVVSLGEVEPENISALVLGGGEILGANWSQALASTLPRPFDRIVSIGRRILPPETLDFLSRRAKRGTTKLPYLPSGNEFQSSPLLANAIGASSISELSPERRGIAIQALARSTHLSVRDSIGASLLSEYGLDPKLVPDSVAILNRIHPVESVRESGVMTFQCSDPWYRSNERYLISQLVSLSSEFSKIRLVPIGLAGDHSDDRALRKIADTMRDHQVNVELVSVEHIWDVADAIGTSDIFVGSSLHGNITAMAYGIPSVGLCQTPKLTNYLQTWGDGLRPSDVQSNDIANTVRAARLADPNLLRLQAEHLDKLSWSNTVELIERSVK